MNEIAAWFSNPANWAGPNGIPTRLLQHVGVSGVSLLLAAAIALPIGLFIGHTRRGVRLAVNLANLGRAVPSLAMIALVVPITTMLDPQAGFKVYPTIVAMVVLAIPPILVNSYAGVAGVDRELVESARGMGLRERQILGRVEVPIALPVIVGGLRSATVQIVATATLGAIYGLGALGAFVVEGVAQQDYAQVFGGVILVGILALGAEAILGAIQRRITSPGLRAPAR
jgi:osmoprotectant transport system permease protein